MAVAQTIPLVALALVLRVSLSPAQLLLLLPVVILSCLLGGSFGLVGMSLINSQQAANQIFNFLLLPQLFLAGVFNPIKSLPWYFEVLSRLSPLRYVVDLLRDVMYANRPHSLRSCCWAPRRTWRQSRSCSPSSMVAGTTLFVRRETNR